MSLLQACPPTISEKGDKITPFHSIFNTESEFILASQDYDLGAIYHLSPLENPTLIDMKQAYGERAAITWLLPHVAALNAASGASNRMDASALALCCRDIIAAFPWLSLVEFCLFCPAMRSLRYARKRSDYVFSSDTIMQGLREFHDDIIVARQRYDREHRPQPDLSNCISREQAINTEEYRIAYEAEMKKIAAESKPTSSTLKLSDYIKDLPITGEVDEGRRGSFSSPRIRLSDNEFAARRDEQLARLQAKYHSAQ